MGGVCKSICIMYRSQTQIVTRIDAAHSLLCFASAKLNKKLAFRKELTQKNQLSHCPTCPTPGTVGHLGQCGTTFSSDKALVPVGQPPPVGQGQFFSLFSREKMRKMRKVRKVRIESHHLLMSEIDIESRGDHGHEPHDGPEGPCVFL